MSVTPTQSLMNLRVLDEAVCTADDGARVIRCSVNATGVAPLLAACVPCDGRTQAEVIVDVRLGEGATLLQRIRIEAAPPLSNVQGEVLSTAGARVAGASVRLNGSYAVAADLGSGAQTCTYDHRTTTDAAGRYVLEGVAAAELNTALEVSKEGWWSATSLLLEPFDASFAPEGQLATPYLVRQVRLSDPSERLPLGVDVLEVAIGSFFAAGDRVVASGAPVRLDVFGGIGETSRPLLSYSSAVGETISISADELLAVHLDAAAPMTLRATVVEEYRRELAWADAAGSHLDVAPATAVAYLVENARVELLLFAAPASERHLHAVLEWDPSSSQLPLGLSLQYVSGEHAHTVDSADARSSAAAWVGFEPSNVVGRDFTSAAGREAVTITDPSAEALFVFYAVMEERRCVGISPSAADVPGGVDGFVDCTGDCGSGANYCAAHFSQQAQATVCGRCRAFGDDGDSPMCAGAPQGLFVPTDPSFAAVKCDPAPWLDAEEKNCARLATELAAARASLTLYSGATKLYEWHVQTEDAAAAIAACAGVREASANPYAIALPRVRQAADGSAHLAGLDGWAVRHTMASLLEDRSKAVGKCLPRVNGEGGAFPEVSFSVLFSSFALAFVLIFAVGFGLVALCCFYPTRPAISRKRLPTLGRKGVISPVGVYALSFFDADSAKTTTKGTGPPGLDVTERASETSAVSSQRSWLEQNLEEAGFGALARSASKVASAVPALPEPDAPHAESARSSSSSNALASQRSWLQGQEAPAPVQMSARPEVSAGRQLARLRRDAKEVLPETGAPHAESARSSPSSTALASQRNWLIELEGPAPAAAAPGGAGRRLRAFRDAENAVDPAAPPAREA